MPQHDGKGGCLTRRRFAQALAVAAATSGKCAEASERDVSLADALVGVVRAHHGRHLSEDQLREVKRDVARTLVSAEQLRRVPLENGDAPAGATGDRGP